LASPFKSKSRLEAENVALRHQLIVLRRKVQGRVRLTNNDRWFFIQLYRWFPSILQVLTIIRPETLVRWHRAGSALQRRSRRRKILVNKSYQGRASATEAECPFMALNRHQCRLVACLLIRVKRTCPIHGVMSAPDPKSRRWLPVQTLAARHILIRPRIGLSMGPAAPRAYLRVAVCTWHCWSAKAWAEDVIDDCYRQTPHQRRY
jgi:hypothetical protein